MLAAKFQLLGVATIACRLLCCREGSYGNGLVRRKGKVVRARPTYCWRCREIALTPAVLVQRAGYRNVAKGLRRLADLCNGELAQAKFLLDALPNALEVPDDIVAAAVRLTRQQLDAEQRRRNDAADRAWRQAFRPHAIILTERTTP